MFKPSLKEEYLLNIDGKLEIHKKWDFSKQRPREEVFAFALHPSADNANDLLKLKISDLKKRAKELGVLEESYDSRTSNSIRKAIRETIAGLNLTPTLVPLNEGGAKDIWEALGSYVPTYALFKSDRPSRDTDPEFQDPMKVAVENALRSLEAQLDQIKQEVKKRATEVATRTLEKLKEMSPALAAELSPRFEEPRWNTIFKLSLTGEDEIPINKRGSGTRRLILLNFFRAEAERLSDARRTQEGIDTGTIYAIEEPETSQHPDNQEMLIKALEALSQTGNNQVIITTHVPALAGLVPADGIRHVIKTAHGVEVRAGQQILKEVAQSLGVLPDISETTKVTESLKVLVCVEGQRDIDFLSTVSKKLKDIDPTWPSLREDSKIRVLPLGGNNLKDWVFNDYLKGLGRAEVHIYDRGNSVPPKYQDVVTQINTRGASYKAFLTKKNEIENYIHPLAIKNVLNIDVNIDNDTDVPMEVAKAIHASTSGATEWDNLSKEKKREKMMAVKIRLNVDVVNQMTVAQIKEMDNYGELEEWKEAILARTSQ